VRIKTRSKKKKKDSGIKNEGQYKHYPGGRSRETQGFQGRGMYTYDYISNKLVKVEEDECNIRFYSEEDSYIEFTPNKGYLICQTGGHSLMQLLVRGRAINCVELKALESVLDKDGEGTVWHESERRE